MSANYVLLETIELNQSAASVTFDNIPQTGYTDLKVVVSARTSDTNTGTIAYVRFNGSSSTYSSRYLQGRGDSTLTGSGSTSYGEIGRFPGVNAPVTNNMFSNTEIIIPNYSSSNNKSYSADAVTEANQSIAYAVFTAGLWSTSSAITSILIASTAGNLVAGSTFSLYGIAAFGTTPEIAPLATGGNIVANDGTYWYHAFLSSGTFTPQKALSCDALVIAGGGAGGNDDVRGGGGGAGGIFYATSQSVLTAKTVTIGAGGTAGNSSTPVANTAGSNSTFEGLTSAVGGGRGAGNTVTGSKVGGNGGSGGGGTTTNSQPSTSSAGGSSTQTGTGGTGYGNAGGAGGNNGASGGGGGGAGAAGTGNISSYGVGGTGGAGLNTWSVWATATNTGVSGYYAGGGGGGGTGGNYGAGGAGGGGRAGDNNGVSVAGTVNTGGGGGGRGGNDQGSAGGSGIVIIRYPMSS